MCRALELTAKGFDGYWDFDQDVRRPSPRGWLRASRGWSSRPAAEERSLPSSNATWALSLATKFYQILVKISSKYSKLFIIFCIQYYIFQHFSKSTLSVKFWKKFCKILQKNWKKMHSFFWVWQNSVDFEKCWKMLYWMQKFMKILLKFDEILTKCC